MDATNNNRAMTNIWKRFRNNVKAGYRQQMSSKAGSRQLIRADTAGSRQLICVDTYIILVEAGCRQLIVLARREAANAFVLTRREAANFYKYMITVFLP